jgi:hypothetical protein
MGMSDVDAWLAPKSDQLNADDLIGGSRIIRIRKVKITKTGKQDGTIWFEGDNDKPWKPCKTMGRVLRGAYGLPENWIGKYVELWRDPEAIYAGKKVGGIRIKGLSDIKADYETTVTISKSVRDTVKIRKLVIRPQREDKTIEVLTAEGHAAAEGGVEQYKLWFETLTKTECVTLKEQHEAWKKFAGEVDAAAAAPKPDNEPAAEEQVTGETDRL